MQDIRCTWLPNGFVLVHSYSSGLQALYDPQTDEIRAFGYNGALEAGRKFVADTRS